VVWASLYGFQTQSAELELEHQLWLKHRIVEGQPNRTLGTLWISGRASRRWTSARNSRDRHARNLTLSEQRAAAVEDYLDRYNTQCSVYPLGHVRSTGDTLAEGTDANDPADRAVEIKYQPIPIHRVHVRPPKGDPGNKNPIIHMSTGPLVSTHFRMRVVFGLDLGEVITGGGMAVTVEDTTNGWAASYDITHAAVGGSWGSIPIPATPSIWGPWNRFHTSAPIGVGQLGGAIAMASAGVTTFNPLPGGPWFPSLSESWMIIRPLLAGVGPILIRPFNASSVPWPGASSSLGGARISIRGEPLPKDQMPWPFHISD
jgi:hypothetical protein